MCVPDSVYVHVSGCITCTVACRCSWMSVEGIRSPELELYEVVSYREGVGKNKCC